MKIIIDEREDDLYDRCHSILNNEEPKLLSSLHLSKEVLLLGDVLIKTDDDKLILLIERKGFSDLLASIKDGRYEEQSYRLTHTSKLHLHNVVYVLEGVFSQLKTVQDKKLIYSATTSLNYFKGFSVLKTSSVRETAELIIYMADKIARDTIKGKEAAYRILYGHAGDNNTQNTDNTDNTDNTKNTDVEEQTQMVAAATAVSSIDYCNVVKKAKKDNITCENIGHIILSQIPGISSTTSTCIMKQFRSFPHFMQSIREDASILDTIQCETNGKPRKLGKNCVQSIKQFLIDNDNNIGI
jgi:ERCC4-type nuclease